MEMFKSNSTVLSAPMSTTQVSLFGSLTNMGGLIATPFCGYAVDKFGRKYSAMIFGVPFVVRFLDETNYVLTYFYLEIIVSFMKTC